MKNNTIIVIGIILIASLSRLIPHPSNFAPLGAIAMFGGYYFKKSWQSFAVTAGSWWLTDLVLNNLVYKRYFTSFTWLSASYLTVLISLIIIMLISKIIIKKVNFISIITASMLSSLAFFIITNFGSFWEMYPHTLAGLGTAFNVAIPFFKNTAIGDLVYSGLIFGAYHSLFEAKRPFAFYRN
jgi:hypothetical protein